MLIRPRPHYDISGSDARPWRHNGAPVAIGVAIGLVGSFGLARYVESLLYGISAGDPFTLTVVMSVLASVGAVAAYLPARRAGRVDPLHVLREE